MHTSEALEHLHTLLGELAAVQKKIDRGPSRLKAKRGEVEARAAEIEVAREAVTALKMQADQKSLQLKSNEEKLVSFQQKLNEANNNRDYQLLIDQMEADKMANSVLEDEILELLDKVDAATEKVGEAEAAHQAAIEQEQRVAEMIEADLPGLEERATELRKKITEAEAVIPAKHRSDYQRMRDNYGPGALSPVQGGACSNCYVSIAPQTRMELKSGQFVFCRTCSRILFLEKE